MALTGYGMPAVNFGSLAMLPEIYRQSQARTLGDLAPYAGTVASGIMPNGGGEPTGGIPASIRYNNPGAQYPGPTATQFGSSGYGVIGGGHKIARFATPEQGAAAQFGLLGRRYVGKPLGAAITEWSGGNSSPGYIAAVSRATGLNPGTIITPELLQSPQGIGLAKAMARQEAGREFPMTNEQWARAQAIAFGGR